MKRPKVTEAQMASILRQVEEGVGRRVPPLAQDDLSPRVDDTHFKDVFGKIKADGDTGHRGWLLSFSGR